MFLHQFFYSWSYLLQIYFSMVVRGTRKPGVQQIVVDHRITRLARTELSVKDGVEGQSLICMNYNFTQTGISWLRPILICTFKQKASNMQLYRSWLKYYIKLGALLCLLMVKYNALCKYRRWYILDVSHYQAFV